MCSRLMMGAHYSVWCSHFSEFGNYPYICLMKKPELLERRAEFVRKFVESNSEKGIKTSFSIRALSEQILFITVRSIYTDLATAKDLHEKREHREWLQGKNDNDENVKSSKF